MNGSLQTKLPLSSHLKELEDEAIYILREWSPSFGIRAALLHRQGFRACCCVWRSRRSIPPAAIHIIARGYQWKFREMIAFREATVQNLGLKLIVHVNEEGLARGIDPIASGLRATHAHHEDRGLEAGAECV